MTARLARCAAASNQSAYAEERRQVVADGERAAKVEDDQPEVIPSAAASPALTARIAPGDSVPTTDSTSSG